MIQKDTRNGWIVVDSDKLNEPSVRREGNIVSRSMVSLYDLPEAVRTDFDESTGTCTIRIRYIDGAEAVSVRPFERGVSFGLGKRSGRVHSIAIQPAPASSNCSKEALERAEDALIKLEQRSAESGGQFQLERPRYDNYRVLHEAIRQICRFMEPVAV